MRDTIDMAREAGDEEWKILIKQVMKHFPDEIERFADLVRADEREVCAKVCVKISLEFKSMYCGDEMEAALICEKAIRARGNT